MASQMPNKADKPSFSLDELSFSREVYREKTEFIGRKTKFIDKQSFSRETLLFDWDLVYREKLSFSLDKQSFSKNSVYHFEKLSLSER